MPELRKLVRPTVSLGCESYSSADPDAAPRLLLACATKYNARMGAILRLLGNARIWPGPVLAVELVTMSRRTRYFALRMIYAAALFVALWTTYEETARWRRFADDSGDMNSIAAFTAAFFATFGAMQLLAVLLIGPALAAGTIAQERERRTIEYLYATPLSNLEIVIGKLGGRVLQILGLVLAGVPVLALAMLLGGITPGASSR